VPAIELVGAPTEPMLSKSGTGPDNQIVLLGSAIESLAYIYANATSASVTGLPAGVTATVNTTTKAVAITGTPTVAGSYAFSVTTTGGTGAAATLAGTIKVVAAATAATVPTHILSMVNAAYPTEGIGDYEDKNLGWIDSGYYNVTNTSESYAVWKLKSQNAESKATLVIRFANGGTSARHMDLAVNNVSIGAAPFAKTAAWTTWDSVSVSVQLLQGLNTIKLSSMGSDGGPNIDEFEFDVAGVTLWRDSVSSDTGAVEDPVPTMAAPMMMLPRVASYDFATGIVTVPDDGTVAMDVFDLSGQRIVHQEEYVPGGQSDFRLSRGLLPRGVCFVRVSFRGQLIGSQRIANLR